MNKTIDILGNEISFDCMGCDIADHKLIPPGGYIYEDDLITIAQDPEIPIVGFMILGTKKHIKSINDLSNEERHRIMDVLNLTIENMKKIGLCKEVLIIQEESSSHFHIWILPVFPWMDKYDKSVRDIQEIISYAKDNYNESVKKELLETIDKLKTEFRK
ncbi:MAG: hypothetical protein J6X33_04750 [Clostridiales bacterium]|nr:hypothetical protein [Clostridiales bacterium]